MKQGEWLKSPELTEKRELALKISELGLKGFSATDIAKQLNVTRGVVNAHLKGLERLLLPAEESSLLYRKNERLAKLQLLEKEVWSDIAQYRKEPNLVNSFRRILMSAYELGAKIEGLISEKVQVQADKALSKLLEDFRVEETKAKKDGDKVAELIDTKESSV